LPHQLIQSRPSELPWFSSGAATNDASVPAVAPKPAFDVHPREKLFIAGRIQHHPAKRQSGEIILHDETKEDSHRFVPKRRK